MPEPGGVHVLTEVLHQPVVCRDVVFLAALLVQQECPLVVAQPVVLHVHCDDRADASECVEHGADQCTISKSRDPVYRDGLEQGPGLVVAEDRGPADPDDVPGSLDRRRRVGIEGAPRRPSSRSTC